MRFCCVLSHDLDARYLTNPILQNAHFSHLLQASGVLLIITISRRNKDICLYVQLLSVI